MIVESGFRGCDNKGRHGPDLGQITWNPKAGAGGAFMMAIPNVLNNPPICYLASPTNLCGPPTTSATAINVTNAAATATVPPGPGAFAVNFWGQSYIPGPWLACVAGVGPGCTPSQGGYPAGGCIYPTGAATNNLVGSVNNQANGGFEWDCDGALAMIDPVYVYKGPKQPNILTGYPMYNPGTGYGAFVGQPYDGACSKQNAGPPLCIADPYNTYPLNLANCPNFLPAGNPTPPLPPAACPNHLVSPGVNYPAPIGPLGNGIVFQPTTDANGNPGSIGGVVYLPYCSPGSIELGPTDIPGGWDGKGAGDVSSLTQKSSGRTSTFANIILGCNPYWNGNAGTGQGQLTVNIQENYSLALNVLSATSQPPPSVATGAGAPCGPAGSLGLGCGAPLMGSPPQNWVPSAFPGCADPRIAIGTPPVPYTYATALFPLPQNGVSCAFNDFYAPGPFPAVNPIPMFALYNNNVNTTQPWGCMSQYPATPPANGGGTCGGVNPFIPPNAVASSLCTVSGTTIPPSPSTPTCPNVTGNQVMAGQITSPNLFNSSVNINGVTEAKFNMTNAAKDPHWWVAVGGRLWSAGNIAGTPGADGQAPLGVATKGPVIGYIDGLTNTVVEYTPTSSGSNTIALDEQNYVAFLPVNGVQNNLLPAGDFTKNGQNLCGNATTVNGLLSGPGCVIVFRQQYLSPLGTSRASGN
jgi:hypothetical protein